MSLPSNMGSLRKQFYFTMFYTATTVFAFMNSTIYWFITRQQLNGPPPSDPPPPQESGEASSSPSVVWSSHADAMGYVPDAPCKYRPVAPDCIADIEVIVSDLFGEGWFKPFNIFSLYAIPAIFMGFEIMFLNSMKRPYVCISHVLRGVSG